MIKSMLLNMSSLILSGMIFLNSVCASDDENRDQKRSASGSARSSHGFYEEGEDIIEVFLRPGFAQALDCVKKFTNAMSVKNYALAVESYEEALGYYPAFNFPEEMYMGNLYLKLRQFTDLTDEKNLYLLKAQSVVDKVRLKKKELTLGEWRIVRDLAFQHDDFEGLSEANNKIMSLLDAPRKIEDVIPLLVQFHREGHYEKAHQMWKIVLKSKERKAFFESVDSRILAPCFELCVICQDFEGMRQTLSFVANKKEFFDQDHMYVYFACHAYLKLNDYHSLLSLMKVYFKKDDMQELNMVACLSERQADYKEALLARQRMIELDPTRESYEGMLAFCQRAVKQIPSKHAKRPFNEMGGKIKKILAQMEQARGTPHPSEQNQNILTIEDTGKILRNIIAKKHMDVATQLLQELSEEKIPELAIFHDEVLVSYKQCQSIYEDVCSGGKSFYVSDMRSHVEKMKRNLKALSAEKEKIAFKKRQEKIAGSAPVSGDFLPPVTSVNLRKEILVAHGLPQKREKPVDFEEDVPASYLAPCPLAEQEDAPYEVEWVWTSKSQKQRDTLSSEVEDKLGVFMKEVEANPWSVRRDGSLALGEPRHVVGWGANTYERDMDVYNRFIYSVIATGPKSAKVVVLGVQGHL